MWFLLNQMILNAVKGIGILIGAWPWELEVVGLFVCICSSKLLNKCHLNYKYFEAAHTEFPAEHQKHHGSRTILWQCWDVFALLKISGEEVESHCMAEGNFGLSLCGEWLRKIVVPHVWDFLDTAIARTFRAWNTNSRVFFSLKIGVKMLCFLFHALKVYLWLTLVVPPL